MWLEDCGPGSLDAGACILGWKLSWTGSDFRSCLWGEGGISGGGLGERDVGPVGGNEQVREGTGDEGEGGALWVWLMTALECQLGEEPLLRDLLWALVWSLPE